MTPTVSNVYLLEGYFTFKMPSEHHFHADCTCTDVLLHHNILDLPSNECHLAAGKPDPLGPGNWGRGIVL